jgi:hypothetical protein
MTLGAALLTLLVLLAVIVIVTGPLRAPRGGARREHTRARDRAGATATATAPDEGPDERAALEAAREAKYRDLREAELDYRTGKLSAADYEAVRGRLRVEAIEILDALEALGGSSDVEQDDGVAEEQHREADRPAIEVALDHRPAAERTGAAADAERAGEARVLAGVHQHEQHQHDRDHDL